jgi:hypothetical protein
MAYPGMQSALRLRRRHLSPEFAAFLDQLQSLTPLKVFGELVPPDAITSEQVK